MTAASCASPVSFEAIADYWAGELDPERAAALEEHAFGCLECQRRLAEGRSLAEAIAAAVREGRLAAVVTETVLNQLAREGVRVRHYALAPGAIVPCAVWSDDEIIVARVRGDFAALDSVSVATRFESGEELLRADDVPVRPGQTELLRVIPAALLRGLPSARLRLTVTGRSAEGERLVGEYVLEHGGALERTDRSNSS